MKHILPPLLAMAAHVRATESGSPSEHFSTTIPTQKIEMPQNFFAMMWDAANMTNQTNIAKLDKDSRRRLASRHLESTYCANAFANIADGYVWLGDSATADMTSYTPGYTGSSEPYFNNDDVAVMPAGMTMYLIHNAPASGIAFSDELCLEVQYEATAIDINPDGSSLDFEGSTGVTCENCYAYAGATITVGMYCYTNTNAGVLCEVSGEVYGGFKYNLDFQLQDPTITTTAAFNLYTGSPVELVQLSLGSGALALTVEVTPKINAALTGSISGTGSLSLTASAEGSLSVAAKVDDAGFSLDVTPTLTFSPLTFDRTSFIVTGSSLGVTVTPELEIVTSVTCSAFSDALISLTKSVTYPIDITITEASRRLSAESGGRRLSSCGTTLDMNAKAGLVEVGSPFLGYSADVSAYSSEFDLKDETIDSCLSSDTDGSSGGGSGSSSGDSGSGASSAGADAAIGICVTLVLVVVLLVTFGLTIRANDQAKAAADKYCGAKVTDAIIRVLDQTPCCKRTLEPAKDAPVPEDAAARREPATAETESAEPAKDAPVPEDAEPAEAKKSHETVRVVDTELVENPGGCPFLCLP